MRGKENMNKLIDILAKVSILLSIKFNSKEKEEILEIKDKIDSEFEKIQDKKEFLEQTTKRKIDINIGMV